MKKLLLFLMLATTASAATKQLVSLLPTTNVIQVTNYVMVVLEVGKSNVTYLIPWTNISSQISTQINAAQVWTNAGGLMKAVATMNTLTGNVSRVSLSDSAKISTTYSGIIGGSGNTIEQSANFSAISAGSNNRITTNASSGFIGGGTGNVLAGGSNGGMVGGQNNNSYGDPANFMGGGSDNTISINCGWSTILGGDTCTIDGVSGSDYIAILPGYHNFTASPGRLFMYIFGGQNNTNLASDTWTFGENIGNATAKQFEFGFANSRKTTFGDTSNTFRVPISAPTNTAPHTTVAPANLHSVTLGKGWTNDFGVRADLVISVKYVDAASGDPAFAFTNSTTGEAWTNSVAFGLTATTKDTVIIPDISPNDSGSFTDLSGTGASITFLTAWWKLK